MNSRSLCFARASFSRLREHLLRFFIILAFACFQLEVSAAAPDLTAGGVPTTTININLGPTGLQGWLYHNNTDTSESRQILVTAVDASSPADGVLAVGDVILGADGTGANPVNFTFDARRSLALAIQDAEANSPATLKLLRWRSGVTTTEAITLQTLGAYSATAPYNCPKSALILENGLAHRTANEDAGNFGLGTLALLAGNDPSNPANAARQTLAQTEAHALIATQEQIDFWKSGQIDTGSKITWNLGHKLIVLAEYYLKTSDPLVLPTIEAMAVQVANGQSHLGTMGHQLTNPDAQGAINGTYNVGYGAVNSAGMPTFLGLLLAKECGLTNPEIDPAIERASRFYAAYTGYGAHPYGEHQPYSKSHEANGKSGLASLCFMLLDDRAEDGKFFSRMATAAASERELGHTGPYFNQMWAPLGAAAGGEEAVAAHFSRISWMLDLNREWDGGFYWNRLDGSGSGERWNDFDMSTVALLAYALPLRELHITGRAHDTARYLTTQEVAAAVAADDYDAAIRTTTELVTDLGNWSPKVQLLAAGEIGLRTAEHATLVPQLIAIANDTQAGESRVGACFALGEIGDGSAAAVLAALLDDADDEVRYASAEALRYLPQADKLAQVDTILAAAASTGKPFFPIDAEDPLQFAHHRLSMLLFYSGNAYGPKGVIWGTGINGIDRNLLYPAIEAVAGNPNGQARGTLQKTYINLTYDDVLALSGTILDSIIVRAPADKMFSGGVRSGGIEAMQMHNIADGVQACMEVITDTPSDALLELLGTFGGGVYTVEPDPDAIGFLESFLVSHPTGARLGLDGIYQDTNPTPLNALKTIQLVTVDDPTLDLPANSTVLRATAMDHAQGDSVYTWNKVFGPGAVTFTPNGTAAAAHSTVQFDGTPGAYEFEVTMSDSRGLTESYGTVVVLVSDGSAADTTAPPTPSFTTAPTGTSTNSVTMTAQVVTDPEGNGVKYYFTCTSGGGNDSGWQTSPIYTDTGLLPDTTYEYTVTARDLSANLNTSAASSPFAGSTLGLPTSTLSEGVFHILGSSNSPSSNTVHNVSVNGAYAGFQGQGNVGSVSVPVNETFSGTIVDYAFIRESATPNVIETYADGGAGLITYGPWLAREGGNLGNSNELKLWTATDPGAPAFSSSADFTSNTSVGTFDNINGSVDISGVTVGSIYFFYSGYRTTPLFSATMKDAEMVVADVPLPVFGNGDGANNSEHYVCSINFVNNDACDTIDWSMTSSIYNGHPHSSLKGIVLVSSTGQTTMVPNVVGLGQSPAESSIRSAGFSNGTALLRSSSTVPVGSVISQSPVSGITAIENSAVNLVVSNGPPTTVVPNVIGLDQSIAESQIVAQGLVVGNVTTESSVTVPSGYVISQSPNSGSFLVVGATVDLLVSSGPEATTVPNVVGLDETSARVQIVAADLVVGNVSTQSSVTVPAGDVISQSPVGNTSATVGSAVDLVVSLGSETTIIPITSFDPSTFFNSGITAGIDFDVDSSGDAGFQAVTQSGFLSVPADASKSYNVTHNGIIFDIQTTNANLANQARWRGNASAGDLVNDFQQFFGRSATTGDGVTATVTLTGLTANTDYEVSFFTYNVGSGLTTHNFYNGSSTSDPLITTFTASGNQNDYSTWVPGITFGINSGASSTIVVTIHAPEALNGADYDSRLTLNGISVVDPTAPANSAPTWVADPVNEADATEDAAYASTLADDASDLDPSDTLTFAKVSGPSWLNVASDGSLSGTPTDADVSANVFTVSVNDGNNPAVEATLNITVINTNDAPVFTADPIAGSDATEDTAYSNTLAGTSTDDDGDTPTYAKAGGPAWLVVAGNGALSGTPTQANVGLNVFTVNVSDGNGGSDTATLNITVLNTNDAPVFTADPISGSDAIEDATYSGTVAGSATDDDGDALTYAKVSGPAWLSVASDGTLSGTPTNTDVGANAFTLSVTDSIAAAVNATLNITVNAVAPTPKLVRTTVNAVGNTNWTTVSLGQTYTSPVIVATPIYPIGVTIPVVTRITNVTPTSFDLKLDRVDGQTGAVNFNVSVIAVDEGVYTQASNGVTMEAVRFTSTVTAYGQSNWVAEARTLQNSYTSPVVVGQVMSANDSNWSVFWSMGSSRSEPASAANFNVGKHVGQDPNNNRANETIGYIVIESGSGTINGVAYEAGVGADIVQCFGDSSTPYSYSLSGSLSSVSTAAVSQTGMDGNDGSWAVLSGNPAVTTTNLSLHLAEDSLKDSRQKHTNEQVGYIVFE